MKRNTILNAQEVNRVTYTEAENAFLKHCKIRNLSPQTIEYYDENIRFFRAKIPVKYIDEVNQEVCRQSKEETR